ncbi:uncharacterized protein B0P05DRAFT_525097 [Gilbertella persicaria]|uniref:uncharacterized protein n=1 Tax=Gilbertella persicaria TaxID=101096 RepID=UPI00221E6A6F|nr:uncharacterized protein B0P05DRAFT_525097 [Gilbertella persicaria]KAI8092173.1 hypothetical protein B0P05DRAFT_525097 [Gilbertella persicaria]
MLFDRYRNKSKSTTLATSEKKKLSIANSLLKRFSKKKNKKNNELNQPRTSMSLPNIATIPEKEDIMKPLPLPDHITSRQQKRHSADQRRHRHHVISMQDVNRHSITFGHLPPLKAKAMADLAFEPHQIAKLNRLANLPDNTDALLATLGNTTQPQVLVPHRSISHQNLNEPSIRQSLNRTHSESHAKTREIEADPIEPETLADLLSMEASGEGSHVILIDVRNLIDYQKRRIRHSLNVNLPSLLIKRYQRGTIANFNLENFITTAEGREIYAAKHTRPSQPTTPLMGTILEQKAAEAEIKNNNSNKKRKVAWVIYDEDMTEGDQTSQAWTILNVLKRFVGGDKTKEGRVYYLVGGFHAFQERYENWLETTKWPPQFKLNNNMPRRSISYTMGESKNDLHKRTSLFTLDTQAARVNNANALARRAKRRTEQNEDTTARSTSNTTTTNTIHLSSRNPLSSHRLQPQQKSLNRVAEDEETPMTADVSSPRTETDFCFIISEIIPGFLYVGPEIETEEQAVQLDQRHIRRVLNMAEECQDEGLASRSFVYHKIAARDTLEMKNIELVMMEAVHFIEQAKKKHEPIYVHCKAGKSRSITAILAYLVTSERWTLKKAYRHVIKARPNMSPNIGFISELMKMEGKVHGRVSSFMESDWQSTPLPSPEYANELFQLEKAWQTNETTNTNTITTTTII